jgi:hypothetical protein
MSVTVFGLMPSQIPPRARLEGLGLSTIDHIWTTKKDMSKN